jgi:hypothetical protein
MRQKVKLQDMISILSDYYYLLFFLILEDLVLAPVGLLVPLDRSIFRFFMLDSVLVGYVIRSGHSLSAAVAV